MKIMKIFAAALIAALGFTACSKDGGNTLEKQGAPAEVTINLKTPKQGETRADAGTEPGAGNEIAVMSIEFFVFNADGTPDAETPYMRKISNLGEATALKITDGSGKIFLGGVNTTIFADVTAYEAAAATPADVAFDVIKAKIAALELTAANSQTDPGSGGFVMSAEATKNVLAAPAVNSLTMTIERTLSKVERPVEISGGVVTTEVAGDLDMLKELWPAVTAVGEVTDLKWTLGGYVVINGILNSYIFRYEWDAWTAPYMDPATAASWSKTTYDASDAIETVYGGAAAGDKFLAPDNTAPVYVYENSPEKNIPLPGEATTFNRDQVTAFLVKGTFGCNEQADVTRYWRVNLIKDDIWKVYRNSIYRVTLNNVLTPGYATPEEAETSEPVVDPTETTIAIDLAIAPWYIKTQDVDF